MTKARDLRDHSIEELEAACTEARRVLFDLRSEGRQGGKLERPHLPRHQRKEIARLLTVLNEKRTADK